MPEHVGRSRSAERVEAFVKPELLRWARLTSGLSIEDAARKAGVSSERLQSWEEGERRPTIKQLWKLAGVYRRPFAAFYLPEPPRIPEGLRDFRRLPGQVAGKESPKLRFAIRQCRLRRQLAIDLNGQIEGKVPEAPLPLDVPKDSEQLGGLIRAVVNVPPERQFEWGTYAQAFNQWRMAFESIGVLIFQITDVSLTEARGFSLGDRPFPVIAINIKDALSGRIFTMLHEFAHLVLRNTGLCDLDEDHPRAPEERQIEVLCNYAAGAALVPLDILWQEIGGNRRGRENWQDTEIEGLARHFKVGREVLLRRLLIGGFTNETFYRRKRRQYQEEYEREATRRKKGFAPPHRIAVSSAGPLLTKLLLQGLSQELITASDFSEYLEIRLKHLPSIEKAVATNPAPREGS